MNRARAQRYAFLALVVLGLACGDAATAPNAPPELVVVSLVGLGSTDAGVVLQLTGAADQVESAAGALDVAWVTDASHVTTVVIVGPLSEGAPLVTVRRRAGLAPLRADVREVASADGAVAAPTSARAIVRSIATP